MAFVSVILSGEAIIGSTISFNYDLDLTLLLNELRARDRETKNSKKKQQQQKLLTWPRLIEFILWSKQSLQQKMVRLPFLLFCHSYCNFGLGSPPPLRSNDQWFVGYSFPNSMLLCEASFQLIHGLNANMLGLCVLCLKCKWQQLQFVRNLRQAISLKAAVMMGWMIMDDGCFWKIADGLMMEWEMWMRW